MKSRSKEQIRILFVGNSFTQRNNLPALIADLALTQGVKVVHELISVGGEADSDKVREIRAGDSAPASTFSTGALPATSNVSPEAVVTVLGKGQAKDGMYKVVIGKKTKMPCGCEVGKEMGVNTWTAFYGSDDNAIVDGDFAVYEGELQGVLKSLRSSGINIVAIHNHMEMENPRVLFLHY